MNGVVGSPGPGKEWNRSRRAVVLGLASVQLPLVLSVVAVAVVADSTGFHAGLLGFPATAFEVSDDGIGLHREGRTRRSGLTNMADRLAALGGSPAFRSQPRRGTGVAGRIPAHALGVG